jgi:hypothetical protein
MPRSISPRVSPRAAKKNEELGWSPSPVSAGNNRQSSNRNPLDFVERDLVLPAVVEFGRPRRFVVRDLLRDFEFTAVLQIRRDAGRAEGVIANARFDAGPFRTPEYDAVSALLEEGIGCKLTGLAAGAAEELERPPPGIVGPCGLIEKGPRCRL